MEESGGKINLSTWKPTFLKIYPNGKKINRQDPFPTRCVYKTQIKHHFLRTLFRFDEFSSGNGGHFWETNLYFVSFPRRKTSRAVPVGGDRVHFTSNSVESFSTPWRMLDRLHFEIWLACANVLTLTFFTIPLSFQNAVSKWITNSKQINKQTSMLLRSETSMSAACTEWKL